jgi:AcrR family transcriptional regulator
MSPRYKTLEDDEIFQGVRRAIGRVGPERLTLAEVAREAGLAPATLIQRFGTKRKLLLAFTGWRAKAVTGALNELIDGVDDLVTVEAVLDALLEQTVDLSSPTTVMHHLAALQMELHDAEFRSRAAYHARGVVDAIAVCLEMAQREGLVRTDDPRQLAHLLHITFLGALLTWVVEQRGSARHWVARAIDLVMIPYRSEGARGR